MSILDQSGFLSGNLPDIMRRLGVGSEVLVVDMISSSSIESVLSVQRLETGLKSVSDHKSSPESLDHSSRLQIETAVGNSISAHLS